MSSSSKSTYVSIGAPICAVICSLFFSIPLFVVAGVYWDDECQNNASEDFRLRLDHWLVVMGVVNVLFAFLAIPGRCLMNLTWWGAGLYMGWAGLYFVVMVVWNVVGSIVLFRYSDDCIQDGSDGKGLWILTLILLIGHWVYGLPFLVGQFVFSIYQMIKLA